jgi:trk system potassium uptake protein TrkH
MLLSRAGKVKFFFSSIGFRPARLIISGYFLAICSGAILLSLPSACTFGNRISLIDALFTSTSAVCITGLTVLDTATYFSRFGQVIILLLIQFGGLGIMTFSVFLAILLGRRVGIDKRIIMHDVLDRDELSGAVRTISFIIRLTFLFELIGAISLSILWYPRFGSMRESFYHGCFHSVSAFCNAGFSTFSDNLMGFASDIGTNVVICLLVISGSLGFMVFRDLFEKYVPQFSNRRRARPRLKIQTIIILFISIILVITGSLAIYVFETNGEFFGSQLKTGILRALFQATVTRSAGFNTCDISQLSSASLFLMLLLMFIGGAPGSTGGGLKITTVAVLWRTMISGFTQKKNVEILKRSIPSDTIQKATTLLLFYLLLLGSFVLILLAIEKLPLINIIFEVVSAGATVGMSTGITASLSEPGRVLIMILMFVGRLGLLTIGYALVLNQRKADYTYAEERVMIG